MQEITDAYKKIPEGIKVSIGVELDQTVQGVVPNYGAAINEDQGNLFERSGGNYDA